MEQSLHLFTPPFFTMEVLNPQTHSNHQASGYPPTLHRNQPTTTTTTVTSRSHTPPPQGPPPTARTHHPYFPRYQRPCSSTIQCFMFLVVAAFLLAFLVFLLFLLMPLLGPHDPKFRINSITISPFVVSNSKITAVWYISFCITNPNERTSIIYRNVKGFVYYKNILLSSAKFSTSIYQPNRYEESVVMTIPALSLYVQNDVVNAIVRDLGNEVVAFSFKVHARVSFRHGSLPLRMKRWLMATCDNVMVRFFPNTNESAMMNGSGRCTIDLSR